MKNETEECYMCAKAATGREHIPPRCLFPKSKDLDAGENYRNNLLTVPSCDQHNSEKSGDDQYFLNVLTGSELINEVGRNHYRKQIRRQNARNASIISRFADRSKEINNRLAHEVEIDRLDAFVEHLGFAIFFAHFQRKWQGEISWFPEFLFRPPGSDEEQQRKEQIVKNDLEFENVEFNGANPEVFKYQVLENGTEYKIRFHFYEGCKVLLVLTDV